MDIIIAAIGLSTVFLVCLEEGYKSFKACKITWYHAKRQLAGSISALFLIVLFLESTFWS